MNVLPAAFLRYPLGSILSVIIHSSFWFLSVLRVKYRFDALMAVKPSCCESPASSWSWGPMACLKMAWILAMSTVKFSKGSFLKPVTRALCRRNLMLWLFVLLVTFVWACPLWLTVAYPIWSRNRGNLFLHNMPWRLATTSSVASCWCALKTRCQIPPSFSVQ